MDNIRTRAKTESIGRRTMKGEYTKEIEALYAMCEKMIEYHKRGDKAKAIATHGLIGRRLD